MGEFNPSDPSACPTFSLDDARDLAGFWSQREGFPRRAPSYQRGEGPGQTLISSDRIGRNRHGATTDAAEGSTRVDDTRPFGSTALKQDWVFDAGERSSLKWGFDARRPEAQYIYRSHVERTDPSAGPAAVSVTDRNLILDPSGSEIGAYVAGRFRILSPLTLEVGVRRDRQSLTGEAESSPRANLVWALGERTHLRAGWGRFHQPQGINELQIETARGPSGRSSDHAMPSATRRTTVST